MTSANLAADIERLAGDEPIESVAISGQGGLLSWDAARPILNVEYDSFGWDGPRAPWLMAWTASRVIFTHDYDYATTMCALPRNPTLGIGTHAVGEQ